MAQSFNVQAVPTMIVIVNEKIVQTIVGFKPASEIEKIVSKY
ncbi:MAG: thioredoxin family protein [Mycoplasmoidaceae bacterium]|nr:thioredoxin family protein [Mycoplasmoidaceae bacterium]